jgi:hypothetical protein
MLKAVSTTYGAIAQTANYTCDRNPGVTLDTIQVAFPCSHDKIVKQTEAYLSKWNTEAKQSEDGRVNAVGRGEHQRVRMVIVDSIASNPG